MNFSVSHILFIVNSSTANKTHRKQKYRLQGFAWHGLQINIPDCYVLRICERFVNKGNCRVMFANDRI